MIDEKPRVLRQIDDWQLLAHQAMVPCYPEGFRGVAAHLWAWLRRREPRTVMKECVVSIWVRRAGHDGQGFDARAQVEIGKVPTWRTTTKPEEGKWPK